VTRTLAAGVAVVALAAAGCGSSSRPAITAGAASQLSAQVAAVRAAAAGGNPAAAEAQLARLRVTVATLEHAGQLSASRAATVLVAAAQVESQLGSLPTTTTTTSTTTTVAPPPPTPAPKGDHHGPGKGGD